MSELCSWVTGLFTPRRAQAAFGVTLPIKAELVSTQISNVHLVLYGDGEPGALKVICFENARRAIVEREVAAQKLAHDHENVLTLLKDEIVPTGARSTLHAHTTHACLYTSSRDRHNLGTDTVHAVRLACVEALWASAYPRRCTYSQRRRAGAAPALSVLRRRHVGGGAGAAPRRPRRGGGALAVERIQPSRQASSPNAHPTTITHTPTPTRTLTPTPQPRARAQAQPQPQPYSGGARHFRAVHRRRGALPRARRDPPRRQAHQHLLRRAQQQRRHCKRQPRRGALGVRVRVIGLGL